MTRIPLLLASAAALTFASSAALADCRQELAAFTGETDTGTATQMTGSVSEGTASDETPALGTDGIIKDGSLAPLEQTEAGANTGTTTFGTAPEVDVSGQTASGGMADPDETANLAGAAAPDAIKKDGSTMPLASDDGGGDPHRAISGQDAQAQQEGKQTAAASVDAYEESPDLAGVSTTVEEAVAKAQIFLSQGNEEACMAALEDARRLRGE